MRMAAQTGVVRGHGQHVRDGQDMSTGGRHARAARRNGRAGGIGTWAGWVQGWETRTGRGKGHILRCPGTGKMHWLATGCV